MIVASILMAFGIDAWWDGQQERREVRRILEGLEGEFLAHRLDLETVLARTHAVVVGLGPLMREDTPVATLDDQEIREGAINASRRIFDWDVRRGVLDAVISGGRLSALDPELQNLLLSWPRLVDDVLDNQQLMQNFQLGTLVPVLAREHAPLWASAYSGAADFRPEHLATYREVLGDPEVRGLLAMKSLFFSSSVNDIRAALEATDQILAQIRRRLDGPS